MISERVRLILVLALLLCGVPTLALANNTRADADNLGLNTSVQYSIDPEGDVDWLRISVTQDGTLRLWTTGDTDTVGTLTDANGNILAENDDIDAEAGEFNFGITHDASPGTYYIKVEGYTDAFDGVFTTGPYELHSEFDEGILTCNHNNTLDCADDFALNSTLSYFIDPEGDIDWLRISVTQSGTLRLWTTGDTDTVGTLTDANGDTLAENDDIDVDAEEYNFEIVHDVSPGTYYLKVEGYTDVLDEFFTTGAYELHSEFGTVSSLNLDVNKDGEINIEDLISVAFNYGKTVAGGANPNADVNNDGRVDVLDLVAVATAIDPSFAAPDRIRKTPTVPFTTAQVQKWIVDARAVGAEADAIAVLTQLLTALTEIAPDDTVLLPNYPNPFNPETWIPYQLAKDAEVRLTIYNIQGSVVRELALGHQMEGYYTSRNRAAYWDGKDAFGESVASGVYFYTLTAGDFNATRKMLIRK